tara:strand:+ start:550 stop:681 length:132 start_codon:yes stop_codon:yes gene_type:complete
VFEEEFAIAFDRIKMNIGEQVYTLLLVGVLKLQREDVDISVFS